jgi:hypothetical protein
MAISRSLMNRQLRANGGIMDVTPRENFGLGSSLKKFVRKIIPNEVADIAVKAAPFVAPFNPALAGVMGGLGTFDQTGSIRLRFKSWSYELWWWSVSKILQVEQVFKVILSDKAEHLLKVDSKVDSVPL